ncbi:MAG: peptidase T [Pirellula sp.]|jgi:tripeptide aminopeptidase
MLPQQRLIDRFCRYVQVGTTANPDTDQYPSSHGQLLLGKMLAEELHAMGAVDAHQDPNGLVWATIPGNVPNTKTILLNAHLDTSPEAPGDSVQPVVMERYTGGDILLANGDSITLGDTPELASLVGHTLVTTDGTTLLGGDDKAGVAAIMEIAQRLLHSPDLPHGPIRVLFTCDEEIGRGTKHFDLAKASATAGYTLDGGGSGSIDVETFSADMATVSFRGRNTHPSVGKGVMINALRAASHFVSLLPRDTLSPESTCDREGFLHPYRLDGNVGNSTVQILLRDFITQNLREHADTIRTAAEKTKQMFPGLEYELSVIEQYRNMGDVLRNHPAAVELAEKAFVQLGRPYKRDIIRGGTDGALMSALGLPTPNLSIGQFNIHSTREFASITMIEQAIEHMICLLGLWATTQRN